MSSRFWARSGLAAVLALFLAITGLFNVLHPIWEAPDEPGHYEYLRYIAEHGRLPELVSTEYTDPGERNQTPLYYLLQALLVGWIDDGTDRFWHPNPFVTWPDHPMRTEKAIHRQEEAYPYVGYVLVVHLARLVSSLLSVATIIVTYLTAHRLLGNSRLALASAATVAFTPGFAFGSAAINNDNLVTLISSAILLFSINLLRRGMPTPRDGAIAGLLLAAAVMAKLSGLLMAPVLAFTWLLVLWRAGAGSWRQGVISLLPLPLVFLPLAGWWAVINWNDLPGYLSGSGLGAGERSLLLPFDRLAANFDIDLLSTVFSTYWGRFGWVTELSLPTWQYLVILGICALSAAGYVRFFAQRKWRQYQPATIQGMLLLALCVGTFQYALLARWLNQPLAGNNHGRFLYPSIAAVAVLLVIGLAHVCRRRSLVIGLTVGFLALATLAVPFTVSQRMFAPAVMAWGLFDEAKVQRRLDLAYTNGIVALGASLESAELRPSQTLAFDFFWRCERNQDKDFWAAFRLRDPAGDVVVSDHAIPQAFAFSPRLWRAGEVVSDRRQLLLPSGSIPGQYTLEVRLLDEWAALGIPTIENPTVESGWTPVTTFRVRPISAGSPAPRLATAAVFGDQITLVGYSLPQADRDLRQEACVVLFWQTDRSVEEAYQVSVQVLDDHGRLVAQHDGQPYGGLYPTTRWEVGELVPDRHCLDLSQLPTGSYRLGAVVYTLANGKRLPLADGAATLLDLGTVGID